MKTIYFIRHGETDWNRLGRYQGITDVPLNNLGLAQATACGEAMKSIHLDRIISSDLSRARVTAEIINAHHNAPIITDEGLREINFGDWETLSFEEIEENWPGMIGQMYRRPDKVKIPGGESFQDVQKRSWSALESFFNENEDDETILVTCHGGTIRTLLCALLHLPIGYSWNFSQGNTGISRVFYYGMQLDDHNILNLLNDTKHIENL